MADRSPSISPCTASPSPERRLTSGTGQAMLRTSVQSKSKKGTSKRSAGKDGAVLKQKVDIPAAKTEAAAKPKIVKKKSEVVDEIETVQDDVKPEASLPSNDGGTSAEQADGQGTDRMRAALQALRQRRADLDAAHLQLDTVKKQAEELRSQLKAATAERDTRASAMELLQKQLNAAQEEAEKLKASKASLIAEAEQLRLKSAEMNIEMQQLQKAKSSADDDMKKAQAELASARVELQTVSDAKAKLTKDADTLNMQLTSSRNELEASKKKETSATSELTQLKAQLATIAVELEEIQKSKASAISECQTFKAHLGKCRGELEEARREQAAYTGEVEALRTELITAKVAVGKAEGTRDAAIHEMESTRAQLSFLRNELARRGLNSALEECANIAAAHRSGGTVLRDSDRIEVEAAWTSFIGPGLQRLQAALTAAGLVPQQAKGPLVTRAASFPESLDLGPISKDSSASTRKGKREREEKPIGDKRSNIPKKDKKDKKDKKAKKDRKGNTADNSEDKEVVDKEIVAKPPVQSNASPTEKSDSSSESDDGVDVEQRRLKRAAMFPHRYSSAPTKANLRTARVPKRQKGRSLSFKGILEAEVISYRSCNELLWFPNPQASVECERCKKRVPQRLGQLRGASGGSSFMCDEFYCAECMGNEG